MLLIWRNILGLNTLQLPSQNIVIQTYAVSYKNSTRWVSWTLRQRLKEKDKTTKYQETFHNFLSKGKMTDTIVKLSETGLAKIQKNSTENTLVLRKDGLDKSMFFPSLPTSYNFCIEHTSKKKTPKPSKKISSVSHVGFLCEHVVILDPYRIN